jgi:hypothetical protein
MLVLLLLSLAALRVTTPPVPAQLLYLFLSAVVSVVVRAVVATSVAALIAIKVQNAAVAVLRHP